MSDLGKELINAIEDAKEEGLVTIGPVEMVRFLQQYETGSGNYTEERYNWLGDFNVETIVKEIQKNTSANKSK